MKSGRLYTSRGRILAGEVERLVLFDGKYDTAFRIKSFVIAPNDIITTENVYMKVLTEETTHSTGWRWNRPTEVAWAEYNGASSLGENLSVIDHDALIVEDLFLDATGDSGEFINYMITLEKVEMSEWMGALAMVRNRSQGDG